MEGLWPWRGFLQDCCGSSARQQCLPAVQVFALKGAQPGLFPRWVWTWPESRKGCGGHQPLRCPLASFLRLSCPCRLPAGGPPRSSHEEHTLVFLGYVPGVPEVARFPVKFLDFRNALKSAEERSSSPPNRALPFCYSWASFDACLSPLAPRQGVSGTESNRKAFPEDTATAPPPTGRQSYGTAVTSIVTCTDCQPGCSTWEPHLVPSSVTKAPILREEGILLPHPPPQGHYAEDWPVDPVLGSTHLDRQKHTEVRNPEICRQMLGFSLLAVCAGRWGCPPVAAERELCPTGSLSPGSPNICQLGRALYVPSSSPRTAALKEGP